MKGCAAQAGVSRKERETEQGEEREGGEDGGHGADYTAAAGSETPGFVHIALPTRKLYICTVIHPP